MHLVLESEDNTISISLFKDDLSKTYILTYTDNAGGIKIKPIEKVFEYSLVLKKMNRFTAQVLAMVKMLS